MREGQIDKAGEKRESGKRLYGKASSKDDEDVRDTKMRKKAEKGAEGWVTRICRPCGQATMHCASSQ